MTGTKIYPFFIIIKEKKIFRYGSKNLKKVFSIVTVFACSGKLKIKFKRAPYNILLPTFQYEMLSLYSQCHQSAELRIRKASSSTSKSTVNFLKEIKQDHTFHC